MILMSNTLFFMRNKKQHKDIFIIIPKFTQYTEWANWSQINMLNCLYNQKKRAQKYFLLSNSYKTEANNDMISSFLPCILHYDG